MSDQVNTRQPMPTLAEISLHWEAMGADDLAEVFPDLACFSFGWGEPFCFRCGWLAPGPEAADYPDDWKTPRVLDAAWNASSGWLERCHLQDHRHGGSEDASNLVPLCQLCHERQPISRSRESGVDFVNETPRQAGLLGLIQMQTDHHYRKTRRPGKSKAVRAMLRAQSDAGLAFAKAMSK